MDTPVSRAPASARARSHQPKGKLDHLKDKEEPHRNFGLRLDDSETLSTGFPVRWSRTVRYIDREMRCWLLCERCLKETGHWI